MTFTEKIEKLLASNQLKEVIDEFLKFLSEVPQSNREARNDANQLRGQVIILSGRFTELNKKINIDTADSTSINHERSLLLNSFINILNQLPSNYQDLNNYIDERNEEDEWKDSQRRNTIEAYQNYFSKYPNGKYKAATIKLIEELEEVKLKQDSEMKRLASLEKERREKDKAAEYQKDEPKQTVHTLYNSAAEINTASPAKSKKGLFIGLGILVFIVILILIISNTSSNKSSYTAYTTEDSSAYPASTFQNDSTVAFDNALPDTTYMQTGTSSVPEQTDNSNNNAVKAELISAIRLADDAEATAQYNWNTDPLSKSFTGEALKSEISSIEALKSGDVIISNTLEQQDFKNFTISADGLKAEVQLEEVWSSIYYTASTQQCAGKKPSQKFPQTLYLTKYEGGWFITSIVQGSLSSGELMPCN